jgi:arginine-tRNA-protein transferase
MTDDFQLDELHLPGRVPLTVVPTDQFQCPYLPEQTATYQILLERETSAALYQDLMDVGFRRSGMLFYRPHCDACRACVQQRIPVAAFRPSRSQRRVLRRNADVTVETTPLAIDDEAYELYVRYQFEVHAERGPQPRDDWERWLMASPIETLAMQYRVAGRLIGQGIVDLTPHALSSVYFVYDPAERSRSLGTFSALCEIAECRSRRLPYWYVGLFVVGCGKMAYKRRFRPHEMLGVDGRWRLASADDGRLSPGATPEV